MKELDNKKLCETTGGDHISGTLMDAFVTGVKVVYDIGRDLGFSIRRFFEGSICPI